MKNKTEKFNCPVGITLSLIGGKYKVVILWYLFDKKILRYGELQKILKGVTEEDGLVKRKVYPVVPPKVEYSLTELGESIIPILLEMKKWGENYTKTYCGEE